MQRYTIQTETSFPCVYCGKTFMRSDKRRTLCSNDCRIARTKLLTARWQAFGGNSKKEDIPLQGEPAPLPAPKEPRMCVVCGVIPVRRKFCATCFPAHKKKMNRLWYSRMRRKNQRVCPKCHVYILPKHKQVCDACIGKVPSRQQTPSQRTLPKVSLTFGQKWKAIAHIIFHT